LFHPLAAQEPEELSPRNANYLIAATLDTDLRKLGGSATITWRNTTQHETSELRFHLYYNAWLNQRSSYMRAAAIGPAPPAVASLGPDDWAYQRVDQITLLGHSGLGSIDPSLSKLAGSYIQPDDGNPDDRTVLQVALPHPVAPGEEVVLEIDWQLKLPRAIQRVGFEGEYFMVGQWFPQLGVFEPDGTWNCHQFIQTEFYSDFGVYDVTLTTPRGWVVGATGRLASEPVIDGETETRRYLAEDVQDFAFTTSPHFVVHHDRFEHPTLPPVDIELLLLPDHARLRDRYMEAAKVSLERFGTWFRPYPWDRLTVVDPPSGTNTGGMEYPMFVVAESRYISLPKNRLAEANTAHEIGHMWFYGAVANNQFEDAWLDEALTTWAHRRLLDEVYYPNRFEKRYFHGFIPFAFPQVQTAQPTHGADSFGTVHSRLKLEKIDTPSYQIDERTYYLVPYVKGSLMIVTLERYLGWQTWKQVLQTYTERFWFAHPGPADFFQVVEEVSGQNLTWFFDQVYRGSVLFDYAVDRVVSKPARTARGYDGLEQPPIEPTWQAGGAAETDAVHSMVDIRRWGEGTFPLSVRVTFDDGSVETEQWDGRSLSKRFRYDRPSAVHTVEVDPDHVLVLDTNSSNNSWTSTPRARPAAQKWTAKWLVWLQGVMELAAGLS
jgi:hypothetical protein